MEGAKQLEKNRREIAQKLDKDKATAAAREQDVREATIALEAAQKKLWAAQQARRKQASSCLALEVPAPVSPAFLHRCAASAVVHGLCLCHTWPHVDHHTG